MIDLSFHFVDDNTTTISGFLYKMEGQALFSMERGGEGGFSLQEEGGCSEGEFGGGFQFCGGGDNDLMSTFHIILE